MAGLHQSPFICITLRVFTQFNSRQNTINELYNYKYRPPQSQISSKLELRDLYHFKEGPTKTPVSMKETPKIKITVTSSLYDIYTLVNRVVDWWWVGGRRFSARPHYFLPQQASMVIYLKTTWTVSSSLRSSDIYFLSVSIVFVMFWHRAIQYRMGVLYSTSSACTWGWHEIAELFLPQLANPRDFHGFKARRTAKQKPDNVFPNKCLKCLKCQKIKKNIYS